MTGTVATIIMIHHIYGLTVGVLLTAFVAWALLSCLRQSSHKFTFARRTKEFWTPVLVLALLVVVIQYLVGWRLPMGGLLTCVSLYAALYYLGPERQRMGIGRAGEDWGRRDSWRGGW